MVRLGAVLHNPSGSIGGPQRAHWRPFRMRPTDPESRRSFRRQRLDDFGTFPPVECGLLNGGFCQKPTSNVRRLASSMAVYAGNVGRREKM